MKTVGNGRENTLTIPATVFFSREWERDGNNRTGIQIQYYGILGTEYFDRESFDYGRESETQNGSIDVTPSTS
jgi:hypothetical protein